MHTTLAEDAFRLYYKVIDGVVDSVKKDLISIGKSQQTAERIANTFKQKWMANLDKSNCIDQSNLTGLSNNNTNHNNNIQFDNLQGYMPQQKKRRLNDVNNNNSTKNDPMYIQPNYVQTNPHVQGLGIPNINQVHNPFTNPIAFNNNNNNNTNNNNNNTNNINNNGNNDMNIPQFDGPPPILPNSKQEGYFGFDDDDDDDDDDDEDDNDNKKTNSNNPKIEQVIVENKFDLKTDGKINKKFIKSDNNNSKDENNDSKHVPYIHNGRDLNGPLNSDDDDSDEEDDEEVEDKIICQFTKVIRDKKTNEWKVELKNGIMHINGKDYAFSKAVGGVFKWG